MLHPCTRSWSTRFATGRRRFVHCGVSLLLLVGAVGSARAEAPTASRVVVTAFGGDTEEARAVTVLARSVVGQHRGALVPLTDVLRASAAIPIGAAAPTSASTLLGQVNAARLLTGEVSRDEATGAHVVRYRLLDSQGRTVAEARSISPPGDLGRVGPTVEKLVFGAPAKDAAPPPVATLGEIDAFARAAHALTGGDSKAAALALTTARLDVAERLAGAREVAEAVFQDAALPLAERLRAGRLSGRVDDALALAAGATRVDPAARAELARLRMLKGDLDSAARELDLVDKKDANAPEVLLSRAELIRLREDPAAATKIDELVRPLLTRQDPYLPALAFVARLPVGSLDPRTEQAALAAAPRAATWAPTLANDVALRAARSGAVPSSAIQAVRVDLLSEKEVAALQQAASAGSPEAKNLQAVTAARIDLAAKLALDDARSGGRVLAGDEAAARAELAAADVESVSNALVPLLGAFPTLNNRTGAVITITELRTGTLSHLALRSVDGGRLERALRSALLLEPWHLQPSDAGGSTAPIEELSASAFRDAAERGARPAALVLAWYAEADGGDAMVHLTVFDAAREEAFAHAARIDGVATGLVKWNRLLVAGLVVGGAALGFLLVFFVLLTGRVDVDVQKDAGIEQQTIAVLVTRDEKRPTVDPVEFAGAFGNRRLVSRRRIIGVDGPVSFHRLRPGRWWVHVYGVQLRRGELQAIGDQHSRSINLRVGRSAFASIDLRVREADYMVSILDDQPVAGLLVYFDERREAGVRTDAGGNAVISVPHGSHVIRIDTGDVVAEKKVTVTSSRAQRVTIDVGFERRVSRIRLDTDDAPAATIMPLLSPVAEPTSIAGPVLQFVDSTPRYAAGGATYGVAHAPANFHAGHAHQALHVPQVVDLPERSAPVAVHGLGANAALAATAAVQFAPAPASQSHVAAVVRSETLPPLAARQDPDGLGSDSFPQVVVQRQEPSLRGPQITPVTPVFAVQSSARHEVVGGRYHVLRELGRGAMGVVYQAHDAVLDRDVAVKVVGDEARKNPAALDLFLKEAKAMASLNHANLVTVFDQGHDAGEAFMVMELIEGRTLEHVIRRRGKLPIREVLAVGSQMCAGLAYAHARHIIHRDIKPANVFVATGGVVKIGDFGLARAVRELNITHTRVCGTPLYMAPEQIRGADIDFRSDLYALGCTLFELLTGRPPFVDGEILYHHIHTAPPDPASLEPSVPPAVSKLVLACLEKDKAGRVESALALRTMIRAAAGVV